MSVAALSWVCAVAIAVPASAQLGALPVPTLPGLPTSTITRGLGDVLDQTVGSVEGTAQVVSSATRIHRLLRTHRAQVEADPEGAPMVRARLVAVSPTASALDAARAAGFVVVDDRQMDELDIRLVQLAVPPSLSTVAALRRLREMDPAGRYDFDHIYLTSSSQPVIAAAVEPATASPAVQPLPAAATRLGLIDARDGDTLHPVSGPDPDGGAHCRWQSSTTSAHQQCGGFIDGTGRRRALAAPRRAETCSCRCLLQ